MDPKTKNRQEMEKGVESREGREKRIMETMEMDEVAEWDCNERGNAW